MSITTALVEIGEEIRRLQEHIQDQAHMIDILQMEVKSLRGQPWQSASRLLGVKEMARELGVAPSFFYKGAGKSAPIEMRNGNKILFNPEAVRAWAQTRRPA